VNYINKNIKLSKMHVEAKLQPYVFLSAVCVAYANYVSMWLKTFKMSSEEELLMISTYS